MLHPAHQIKMYRKKHHKVIALLTLLVPLVILLVIGMITKTQWFDIFTALGISWFRLLLGYIISLVLGVATALILGTSKFGESVTPVLDVMQNVPSFALIPLFAMLFGYTNLMAILFIASSAIWPIIFYAVSAIRNARQDLNDASRIFGATGWRRVFYYFIPLSFPAILTGSIVAIAIGWEAVIGIEIIGFKNGIGVLLNTASNSSDQSLVIAGISALLFVVFILNRLVWSPLIAKTHAYAD
ncbi:MAG: taurine transporter subunit [Candidatus Taylorbacteria bacterium]|nr:taurine transporter subunit [Candidatus Taylorbacteria bacterium]